MFISTKELSINNQIRAAQIRVIDESGNQLGVLKTKDALDIAFDKGLDLVEIAPAAEIPVCRIMDYGKFKFDKSKKEKEARKRQTVVDTKEVQLSWKIDTHDFNTKLNHTRRFIEAGDKVKICLEFNKGREMAHMELGYQLIEKFEQACMDFSVVEKRPIREGRRIIMFIAPKKLKDEKKTQIPAKTANTETTVTSKPETTETT